MGFVSPGGPPEKPMHPSRLIIHSVELVIFKIIPIIRVQNNSPFGLIENGKTSRNPFAFNLPNDGIKKARFNLEAGLF